MITFVSFVKKSRWQQVSSHTKAAAAVAAAKAKTLAATTATAVGAAKAKTLAATTATAVAAAKAKY